QQLPALPRVKGNKTREAEQHTELHLKLVAHELRGAPHRRVRVSATLCLRHGDHTADTTDADRTRAGAHSCLEHTGVADDAAVLFDYEVPVLRSPLVELVRDAEDILAPLKERSPFCIGQVFFKADFDSHAFLPHFHPIFSDSFF